jgi:hypothetical protein
VKHLYILKTIACLVLTCHLQAQTLYVSTAKGNDKNNGKIWRKAYKTLSKALMIANANASITSILVANGIYYSTGMNAKNAKKDSSLLITRGGLKIFGGYSPFTYQKDNLDSTILDGKSCNHVLVIAGLATTADSVVVDGFTITNGFANGTGSKIYNGQTVAATQGAGVYLCNNANGGKLSLRNCLIAANYASEGGGIYIAHSSPNILNCSFIGNKVSNLGGAAIFNNGGSPQIIGCDFKQNGEGMYGGAIYNTSDIPIKEPILIANCTFSDNVVDQWGAGIYAEGGLFNIANCIFSGNESFATSENAAGGGGIYFTGSTATITNSTFCGNNVANAAGAGIFSEKSQLIVSNCTFSGNNAKYGAALCSRGNQSDIKIYNSILYGNSSCIDKYGGGNLAINYSIIDDGFIGLSNYKTDPLFVSAPAFSNAPFCSFKGGHANYLPFDYHVKAGSQAIDTGSNSFYTTAGGHLTDHDLAGKKRILGNAIDIGAYEFQANADVPTTAGDSQKTNINTDNVKPAN